MPWSAEGAANTLVEAPDPADLLRRIEEGRHGAFFAAPTLWVAMASHADFGGRDLSGLRKAYCGASAMPRPGRGAGGGRGRAAGAVGGARA
jgi:fatty-acyl-CoA synthase|uniref:hypothetical protein n=1 Tax=Nocardiopsis codii TaxID=3065942 RepID=UPI0038B3E7F5